MVYAKLLALIAIGGAVLTACSDSDNELQLGRLHQELTVPNWVVAAEKNIPQAVKALLLGQLKATEHVVHSVKKQVYSTGKVLYRVVLFDTGSQESRKITIAADGSLVDFNALEVAEQSTHEAVYGKLTQDLYLKAKALPNNSLEVEIIHAIQSLPLRPKHRSQTVAHQAAVKSTVQVNGMKLEKDILAAGGVVNWRADHAPIIHATITGEQLLNIYSTHSLVDHIQEKKPEWNAPTADESTQDLKLGTVFHSKSYYGSGEKVGLLEAYRDNCTVWFDHPSLYFTSPQTSSSPTSCTNHAQCNHCGEGYCRGGVCVHNHSTTVAGMVGMGYGIFPYGAPFVQVYFPNTSGWSINTSMQWMYNSGVRIDNESMAGYDQYAQDYYSNLGMVITRGAANNGRYGVTYCHASNVLCTGGYLHLNPPQMYNGSSGGNFASCSRWTSGCDREVPHFVFHGDSVFTTSADPANLYWYNGAGTSLAAPAAAGLVALMYDRWSWPFYAWPEMVRAALMTSADRDVFPEAGRTFSCYAWPDEWDGAGVPNAERIEAMVNAGNCTRHVLYRDYSFDAQGKLELKHIYVPAGKTLRAVISWSGCPSSGPDANGAHADLDLHVLDPYDNLKFNAASYDGTYEIAEIVTSVAGNYTIEIQKFNWQSCSGLGTKVYLGLAVDYR